MPVADSCVGSYAAGLAGWAGVCRRKSPGWLGSHNRTSLLADSKKAPLFSRIFDFLVILCLLFVAPPPPLPTTPPTLKYRSPLPSLSDSVVSPALLEPSRVRILAYLACLACLPAFHPLFPSLEVHGSIFFPKPTSPTPSQLHVSTSPLNGPLPIRISTHNYSTMSAETKGDHLQTTEQAWQCHLRRPSLGTQTHRVRCASWSHSEILTYSLCTPLRG